MYTLGKKQTFTDHSSRKIFFAKIEGRKECRCYIDDAQKMARDCENVIFLAI